MTDIRPSTTFDLHMHSTRSDGRFPVHEVLRRAARGGLDVISITDHDLGPQLRPGPHQVEGREIWLLGGAEMSGVHGDDEFHLLVYFPGDVPDAFASFCQSRCQERAQRYAAVVERIGLPGLPLASTEALAGKMSLTRLHLAKALVDAGHATSRAEAFATWLSRRRAVVPTLSLTFVDAIRTARDLGGLTSWAHPPLDAVDRHLATFVAAGLQGLEAMRPTVSGKHRRRLRAAARRHGLFLTGGSDWHGWGDADALGLFRVEAREIADFVDRLKAA